MTESEIKAIEERADKASKGPWFADIGNRQVESHHDDYYRAGICTFDYGSRHDPNIPDSTIDECLDGEFIASSRQDVPALCQEIRRLRAVLQWYADNAQYRDFETHYGERAREALK